uniref:Glucosidase 2 subunit beta n=1 Tax=Oncorhynchus kisutch TaxID=8019 RepID=A0A8C7I3K5_ONCKI
MSCALLLLLTSLALAMGTGTAVEIQRPRGVPQSKRQFYEENKPFTCLDGSSTIPFDRVNDDYCDCRDGSDEPGTAACPNGSFHCTNAGFRPAFIPSSRINDGICDCCDTTDEYNSGATCQNTCREMGRKERESLQIMAEITKEGFLLKQQLIHEAKRAQEDKQGKLTELQGSKKGLEGKVEALRTVKETAEDPEKEAKERHLKSWEGKYSGITLEAIISLLLTYAHHKFSMYLFSSHTKKVLLCCSVKPRYLNVLAFFWFPNPFLQGLLGGEGKVDTSTFETVWSGIKDKYLSEVSTYVMKTYVIHQSLICGPEFIWICRNLEKEIGFDFGPSAEFAYLYSQCYELSTSEYIYRLCPFNRVSQKPKFGGSETNLGLWGQWAGPEENLYSVMKYDHGQGCWQGPNRSTTVKLTCGKETVVTSTSEPSRCEYLMEFTTPAVCQEPASLDEVLHGHTEL